MKLSLLPLLLISSIGLNKTPIKFNQSQISNSKNVLSSKEVSQAWTSSVEEDVIKLSDSFSLTTIKK
ncbi:MAG: hypothetical protein K6G28_06660 [Acholeplasmatales bacterium]|nr:hypothetical protein [Acholeplasmatales bacterium]